MLRIRLISNPSGNTTISYKNMREQMKRHWEEKEEVLNTINERTRTI